MPDPWSTALAQLTRWHATRDAEAATAALTFIEVELRRRIPPAARRRWPAEQLEDAVQGFLLRLLQRPLPEDAQGQPAAYLTRAFRNRCIDIERGRRRDPAEPWETFEQAAPAAGTPETREALRRAVDALDGLRVEERVVIKMTDAPQLLTEEELAWLAERAGRNVDEVREAVLSSPSVFELTLLFDPGAAPRDDKERRDRMERYRRRRSRARAKLREAL
ncbi:MAG: sigma-70 family RNA polymerase sigma factor [Alphaproteobacteria bacterium]|nr:sigma-70 family RNA polymerase sigma factor [Alphaproteobacteria bacterium]